MYDPSPDKMTTLFALKQWIEEAKIASFLQDRVIFSLWANKTDMISPDTELPAPVVREFMRENSIPESLHFSVSALTGDNVIESLQSFVEHISNTFSLIGNTSLTISDPESVEHSSRTTWRNKICSKC